MRQLGCTERGYSALPGWLPCGAEDEVELAKLQRQWHCPHQGIARGAAEEPLPLACGASVPCDQRGGGGVAPPALLVFPQCRPGVA